VASDDSLTELAAAVLDLAVAPERVLEICCGDGRGVLFLAREFPAARVRGVDASEQAVREAVARVGLDPEGRVAFKAGRPSSLPYPDELFDLVVQRRGRLRPREATRVLRPGGHMIHAEPAGDSLAARWTRRRLARFGVETVHRERTAGAGLRLARRRDG
jgi:ubiquinone/menaquinone biosynthesis C-methylase UbiE